VLRVFLLGLALISSAMAMSQNTVENRLNRNLTGISNDGYKKRLLLDNTSLTHAFLTHKLSTDSYQNNLISNPFASMQKSNPLMWNHDISDTTKLSPHFSVTPTNSQTTYVGLGSYNNIGTTLKWQPTGELALEGSAFISRQLGYMSFSRQVVYGASLGVNYNLTDKCQLNLRGQYVAPGMNDPFLNKSNMFPKTNIGAELQFTPQKNLKFVTGVEYQHNQLEQKWETKSGGKVTIGF